MRQIDARDSPRFAQISTFGRLPLLQDLSGVKAVFVGVPFDDGTTYRTGARFGPSAIRQGSRLLRAYNPFVDSYPFESLNVCDYGDINAIPGYIEDTMKIVETEMKRIASSLHSLHRGRRPLDRPPDSQGDAPVARKGEPRPSGFSLRFLGQLLGKEVHPRHVAATGA